MGTVHRDQLLVDAYRATLAAVQQAREPVEIAEIAAEAARRVLEADGATVTQVQDDCYCYLAASGRQVPKVGNRVPLAGSFTGAVVLDRQPRVFDFARSAADSQGRATATGIVSGMVAPVVVSSDVVGTIGVTAARAGAFDAVSLDALVGFADLLSTAMAMHELRRAGSASAARVRLADFAAEVHAAAEGIGRLSQRLVALTDSHEQRALAETVELAASHLAAAAVRVVSTTPKA